MAVTQRCEFVSQNIRRKVADTALSVHCSPKPDSLYICTTHSVKQTAG
jgi:hypothetical protein